MKWIVTLTQKSYRDVTFEFNSLMDAAKFANIALAPALRVDPNSVITIKCEAFDEGIELVDIDEIEESEEWHG